MVSPSNEASHPRPIHPATHRCFDASGMPTTRGNSFRLETATDSEHGRIHTWIRRARQTVYRWLQGSAMQRRMTHPAPAVASQTLHHPSLQPHETSPSVDRRPATAERHAARSTHHGHLPTWLSRASSNTVATSATESEPALAPRQQCREWPRYRHRRRPDTKGTSHETPRAEPSRMHIQHRLAPTAMDAGLGSTCDHMCCQYVTRDVCTTPPNARQALYRRGEAAAKGRRRVPREATPTRKTRHDATPDRDRAEQNRGRLASKRLCSTAIHSS